MNIFSPQDKFTNYMNEIKPDTYTQCKNYIAFGMLKKLFDSLSYVKILYRTWDDS